MFERLQKPFLTVETGEAYQPIRLAYQILDKDALVETLNKLACLEKNPTSTSWNWFWKNECTDLHFESLESFKKNESHPLRLGTISIRDNKLFMNLPSFKRACIAVPFFHEILNTHLVKVLHADFINKVFGLDERLPHGFTELFKDDELDQIVATRIQDYDAVHTKCELAQTAEEAFNYLAKYTKTESSKKLPYAERYSFQDNKTTEDPDVLFLGFYIFLRGRELVAIRRWFGNTNYSLSDVAEETMEQVFGGMGIDIID